MNYSKEMKNGGGYKSRLSRIKTERLKNILMYFYPPAPFVNLIKRRDKLFIRSKVFIEGKTILDIGSGISKGPGKWLWKNVPSGCKYYTLDIVEGPGVDIVADILNLPTNFGTYDCIILQSVPEHISDIFKLFNEVDRVLNTDGVIYVEMPFLQGVHGDPYDYWRCTIPAFNILLPNYSVLLSGQSGGVVGALVWIICDLLSNVSPWNTLNSVIRFSTRWLFAPLRYIDYLLVNTKASRRLASENFIMLKKIS